MSYRVAKHTLSSTTDPDGALTRFGLEIVRKYALAWLGGPERDLDAERRYPDLTEAFWTVRMDPEYAREQAGVHMRMPFVIPVGGK